jgi:hypothetical protein
MGVLDPVTGLNGYINPANATFANYDVNLPVQYDGGNLSIVPPLGGQGAAPMVGPAGLPVSFTATTSGTTLTVTASLGLLRVGMSVFNDPNLRDRQVIIAQTSGTPGGIGVYTLSAAADANAAGISVSGYDQGNDTYGSVPSNRVGRFIVGNADGGSIEVYSTACTASSFVFITQISGVADVATPLVLAAPGSFIVSGMTTATANTIKEYNYLIIN